ncbi:hypothetical protein D3C75_746470 [compost metagenome]
MARDIRYRQAGPFGVTGFFIQQLIFPHTKGASGGSPLQLCGYPVYGSCYEICRCAGIKVSGNIRHFTCKHLVKEHISTAVIAGPQLQAGEPISCLNDLFRTGPCGRGVRIKRITDNSWTLINIKSNRKGSRCDGIKFAPIRYEIGSAAVSRYF